MNLSTSPSQLLLAPLALASTGDVVHLAGATFLLAGMMIGAWAMATRKVAVLRGGSE